MPPLYGPRRTFGTRSAAEAFARHVTRELTAGGLAHWVEVQDITPSRWLAYVHRFDCRGGRACACAEEDTD